MRRPWLLAVLLVASVAAAQELPTLDERGVPVDVHVPELPTATLHVDAAGEYQVDATTADGDAQLLLLSDGVVVAEDTSNLGSEAHLGAFLAPGDYGVRVCDGLGRAITARLSAAVMPPLPIAARIVPGDAPVTVSVPQGGTMREGSADVELTIATEGTYRIDVRSPDADHDAEMHLVEGGVLLQSDADGGEGTDARIVRLLVPGTYRVRVHDYASREGALVVSAIVEPAPTGATP